MKETGTPRFATATLHRLAAAALLAALVSSWGSTSSWGQQPGPSEPLRNLPPEQWKAGDLIKPEELAKSLADAKGAKPLVLYVGYSILYQGGHIEGSRFVGPPSKPEGLEALKSAVQKLPSDTRIVLYCGCCPWKNCPNIRAAFVTLQAMGFKNVKSLYLPNNFQQDWIVRGFPTQQGEAAK
jgi:thiosulfate/3-mercaptopyruvate sulfurtransferase